MSKLKCVSSENYFVLYMCIYIFLKISKNIIVVV